MAHAHIVKNVEHIQTYSQQKHGATTCEKCNASYPSEYEKCPSCEIQN